MGRIEGAHIAKGGRRGRLELRMMFAPNGQRVEDLLALAHELIDR